jgi:hypothetical protein
MIPHNALIVTSAYMFGSNLAYLARRANLRRTTMRIIFQIRTMRDPEASLSMFLICLFAWQAFVAVFPLTETVARSLGYASFFYRYPKANGGGCILEPLWVQELPSNQRAREQIRFDWHRFKYNVGGIGRDGYRHPPTLERNLPHFDIPKKRIKHWPWRRRYTTRKQKQ